jgi:hypothetical protein
MEGMGVGLGLGAAFMLAVMVGLWQFRRRRAQLARGSHGDHQQRRALQDLVDSSRQQALFSPSAPHGSWTAVWVSWGGVLGFNSAGRGASSSVVRMGVGMALYQRYSERG